ncbi:hypothetical protein M5K25_003171 [Dendrobium thyrsiflorum]|uniref:Uncharacterized protein n=1 Tax=Dendrobium thyrsiflorum TaxID=117978 RepID=A0ABD0VXF8_DENTH
MTLTCVEEVERILQGCMSYLRLYVRVLLDDVNMYGRGRIKLPWDRLCLDWERANATAMVSPLSASDSHEVDVTIVDSKVLNAGGRRWRCSVATTVVVAVSDDGGRQRQVGSGGNCAAGAAMATEGRHHL